MKKFSLRLLTAVLVIAMLIATCSTAVVALNIPYDTEDFESDDRKVVPTTDAKIVAEYYSFISGKEASILSCKAIVGNSHVIPAPTDSDNLVSIDAEGYTVTADTFTSGNYTWKPVKAYLVYTDSANNEIREVIALDENGKGGFDTDLKSYSVEVDYEVSVSIDIDTQKVIVNAPAVLANGVANMGIVTGCEADLETIASEDVFSGILKLTGSINGATIFGINGPGYNAIMALKADRDANNGTFALNNEIDAYKASASKVGYLANNGEKLTDAYGIAANIIALSAAFETKIDLIESGYQWGMVDKQSYDNFMLVNSLLKNISAVLNTVSASDWAKAADAVKADASALELEALDLAVVAAIDDNGAVVANRHEDAALVEAPVAAKTTVKAGVAQNVVNVTVDAKVIGSASVNDNSLSTLSGKNANFLIAEGATNQEIADKIAAMGLCDETLAYWAETAATYNIGNEFYTASTVYTTDAETGAINVTITYTPKTFTVSTSYAGSTEVYYGYNLKLEGHEDANKSYDYKVNGTAKYQGEIIKIAQDVTISRTEGTALKSETVSSMIANSSVGSFLSAEAKAVLGANAFKADKYANLFGTLKFRTPTGATFAATDAENGYKATAPVVASGLLSGAKWNPVSVELLAEDGTILATFNTFVDGVAEFTYVGAFANAKINYALSLDNVATEDVKTLANLPHVLAIEADSQIEILDRMAKGSLYSALGSLDSGKINLIVTIVNASEMSQAAKDSVTLLKSDCVDAAGNIMLYSYLTAYKTANGKSEAEGLKYYYTANNASNIKHQLDVLSSAFNALCPDDENNPDRIIFTDLLTSNGLSDYVEKLDSIREAIDDCKSIAPANEYIDTNSASLGALTGAICGAIGKTSEYNGNGVATYTNSIVCAAPDKTTVNIVINVAKGDGTVQTLTDTITLKKGAIIADAIKNKFDALDAQLTINKNFYDVTGKDAIPSGNVVIDSITSDIVITYVPYTYTVSVPGTPDQIFYYDTDWTVTLPASSNNSLKLVYTIAGETVEVVEVAVKYTFDSLNVFDADRHHTVTVAEVNLENEKIISFAEMMNSGLNKIGASFIPVQDAEGNITKIFRTPGNMDTSALKEIVTNLTMALTMYDDVELGGSVLWDGAQIHIQSILDMMSNSGFSLDILTSVIREDGTVINDAALSDLTPMVDVPGNVGGRLMTSTLKLDGRTMSFYITLSDETPADILAQTRRAIVDVMKDYVKTEWKDGKYQFVITAPDSIYPYYLSQMLLADKVDITDITKLNLKDSVKYEWSLLEGILCDESLSIETFENTLSILGRDADLSFYKGILEAFKSGRKYLSDHAEVIAEESATDEYSGTFTIDLYSAFQKLGDTAGVNDTMMSFVYEASEDAEPLHVDFHFTLSNIIDKDYDAIVFDLKSESLTKKFYCTNDLTTVFGNLGNNAIVVMTQDVTLSKDVYIPGNAIIDLNGYTLTGNISTGGTVRIVDSRFSTEEAGTFDGTFGKGSFILTGGKYTTDVSAHLTNGYYVNENGYVRNKIYTLTKNGNDMEVALSADYINNVGMVDFQAVLVDIAVDIAMTAYTGSAISVDGNYIYNFSFKDVTDILAGGKTELVNSVIDIVDAKGLSNVINSIIGEITDFNALANAINNNEALVDHELSIEHWNIVPYIAEGNYITFDSVPASKEIGRFTVVIEGTEEEKEELATLCKNLSAIEVENFEINVNDIHYGEGFSVDFNGDAKVTIDLSKNRAYAALICAAAAYNTKDWTKQAIYKAALEEYLNGDGTNKITQIIENMTTAEFIATCKTVGGLSCETILTGIGIDVSDRTHGMINLFNSYSELVRICDKVLTRLDITGNGATLAGHKVANTYATYKFQTELVDRVSVSLTIITVPQSENLGFDKPTVDMSDSTVSETVRGFANIALSDGTHGMAIDMISKGISVEDFINMLHINVEGAVSTYVEVRDANGNVKTSGLIATGDVIALVAFNGIEYITEDHVVIVVGDSNGNGKSDIGDAIKISDYYTKKDAAGLTEAQILACDLNGNGKVDIGDAVKLSKKYTNWEEYDSSYSSDN